MISSNIVKDYEYKGHAVHGYSKEGLGHYEDIFKDGIDRLDYALSRHSQVLVFSITVRFPKELKYSDPDRVFQEFLEDYVRFLRRRFSPTVQYLRVREKASSHNPHFHVLLMVDANEIRYIKNLFKADEIWSRKLGLPHLQKGLVHLSQFEKGEMNNSMVVKRGDREAYDEIVKLISYFSKVYSKGNAPRRTKSYSSSLLRRLCLIFAFLI